MKLSQKRMHRLSTHLIWVGFVMLSFSLAHATLVQVTQISTPVGHVNTSEAVGPGSSFQTIQPNLNSSGYTFGYWSIDGNRLTDSDNRSLTKAKVTINSATTITAHYFLATADTDNDGIKDWFEYRNFGNLDQNQSGDWDADGFSNAQENSLGQEPTIKDSVQDGGISSRISSDFVFADTSMVHYKITSNPIGFISTVEGYAEINASITSPNLHGSTNGYHFAYWSVNGIRQVGITGIALNQVTTKLENNSNIVAHYIESTEDSDSDSIMDWFEINQFGNLSTGPSDDPEGDGFSNKQENQLGQEAKIKDTVQDGGISSRISSSFVFADTSLVKYTIKSNPIGFINSSEGYVEINSSVPTQSLNGLINGYYFSYWSVNGTRQAGSTGVALSQINPTIENNSELVAHYFPATQDEDSDSIMDWFEYNQFGNLSNGPNGDPDSDGFSNKQENELGQEANIKDSVQDGGISSRISGDVLFFLQVNNPPSDLQLSKTTVNSEKPSGELVGTLIPTDPDHDPGDTYQISILDGNGSTDRDKFSLSGFDLITTAPLSTGSYFINIRVSDDENEYLDKNFTISAVPDPNKDDDNDGLTYAQEQALGTSDNNPDSDGDGFPDLYEYNYGSNPMDANSIANSAPSDLNSSAQLSFYENQPVGTFVGSLYASDPDLNTTLFFSLSGPNNNLFSIDSNGSLFTNSVFDFESNQSNYSLSVRVQDDYNASLQKNFTITLKNLFEDLDQDGIEDHIDADDDGDGFPDALEIANGTNPRDPKSIINQPPTSIELIGSSIAENAPKGSYVGQFHVIDPDANASIAYQLIPLQSTAQTLSYPFTLEQNGTLKTTRPIDFENEPSKFNVKLIASDEWNASIEKEFSIQILDLDENPPTVSLQGEPVITLLTSDKWIDPGATWTDPEDGSGTVFAQNDFNQTHPTFEEWIQNGKQLPEDMMFIGGTPWFDEFTGKNREDKEVYNMIFGILPGEYKLIYFYRDKAGNLSNLATRRVLVVSPIKVFVQTLDAEIDKNGSVQFGAEVPSGNSHNISEVGIHYGSDLSLSEFSTLPLTLSTNSSNYFSNPESLPGGKEFFYRAYAQNEAGISYGSVKSISIPIDSNSTFWWSDSIEEQGGWETSPWFGSFRHYPKGWIFHADLNWLYAYAGDLGDVWLWSHDHGWLWTMKGVYPHLFNHSVANWFYFLKKQDGIPKFYDYTSESVK